MSAPRRLLGAGIGVAAVHWVLALAVLLLGSAPTALWLALSGALLSAVSVVAYRLIVRADPGDGDDREPDAPPDAEPPWWPQFERELRAHVERRGQPV